MSSTQLHQCLKYIRMGILVWQKVHTSSNGHTCTFMHIYALGLAPCPNYCPTFSWTNNHFVNSKSVHSISGLTIACCFQYCFCSVSGTCQSSQVILVWNMKAGWNEFHEVWSNPLYCCTYNQSPKQANGYYNDADWSSGPQQETLAAQPVFLWQVFMNCILPNQQ